MVNMIIVNLRKFRQVYEKNTYDDRLYSGES